MALSLKLPIKKKNVNTVHNLITFSIVFTNKNRGGGGHFENQLKRFGEFI